MITDCVYCLYIITCMSKATCLIAWEVEYSVSKKTHWINDIKSALDINSSPPSAAYMRQSGIGAGNGLRRQAITCTYAELLLIGPLGTNFSEIPAKFWSFSFMKIHLKMLSAKMAAILSRGWCDAYMHQYNRPSLIQITALSPVQYQAITWTNAHLLIGPLIHISVKFELQPNNLHSRKCGWKYCL